MGHESCCSTLAQIFSDMLCRMAQNHLHHLLLNSVGLFHKGGGKVDTLSQGWRIPPDACPPSPHRRPDTEL